MVSALSSSSARQTIWGLDALQLHARYWASVGVQVVRQGEPSQIVPDAELYLLSDPRSLPIFKLNPVMEVLNWISPHVLFVRLHDTRERGYRERVVSDEDDYFEKVERLYDASGRLSRVVLTPEREIAQLWQSAIDPMAGWRRLRRFVPRSERITLSVEGKAFDRTSDDEIASFLQELVTVWKRPDSTIRRARQGSTHGIWRDPAAAIEPGAKLIGGVWVGAGRRIAREQVLVGPAVMWDEPTQRPPSEEIRWLMIEPTEPPAEPTPRATTRLDRAAKRLFDIAAATLGILLTLWVYPLAMLAIWFEDGWPFFFAHRRETVGGRDFGCVKFRSMRKDAEQIKKQLSMQNQADGPQFFMENDPRLTRVGRFLRKYNLDELPQFFNVLAGHMSIVGPRPSPNKENQYCPAWREARLSVRPGITGLWQTRRTRKAGSDFQEWIKYDIEYVENMSLWLDVKIIFKTVDQVLRKGART